MGTMVRRSTRLLRMLVRTMVRMRTTMMMMAKRRRIRPRCCQTLASPDSCQLPQALLCLRSPRIDIFTFCLLVKILYVQFFIILVGPLVLGV